MYDIIYEELSSEEAAAYLERMGYRGETRVTKECLDELIYLHQCNVPFECLDTYHTEWIPPLDKDSLFDKIVTRNRGGFCFELNGLFVLLLRSLGFDAFSVGCRVAVNRTELGNISHRATIVRLEGTEYIVDVGLGGTMAAFAVEISETRQTGHGETYWVEDAPGGWKLICRLDENQQRYPTVLVAPIALIPRDFEAFCHYMLENPEIIFRTRRTVNRRTPNGHINITNNTLTVREGEEKVIREFEEEELPEILSSYFGMKI